MLDEGFLEGVEFPVGGQPLEAGEEPETIEADMGDVLGDFMGGPEGGPGGGGGDGGGGFSGGGGDFGGGGASGDW